MEFVYRVAKNLVESRIYTWIIGAFHLHHKLELRGRNDVDAVPVTSQLALQCFP